MKRKIYVLLCIATFLASVYIILLLDEDYDGEISQAFSSNVENELEVNEKQELLKEEVEIASKEEKNIFLEDPSIITKEIGRDNIKRLNNIINRMPITDVYQINDLLNDISLSDSKRFLDINELVKKD